MAQVLKKEIKDRIYNSAIEVFYEKDYRSAKLTEIAEKAEIPVALIYTYYKNKSDLFDAVVNGILENILKVMKEEKKTEGTPSERFERGGKKFFPDLLKERKRLIILMDKSAGTKHEEAKEIWIHRLTEHIDDGIRSSVETSYDIMIAHILAHHYVEGLMEIARHYQGDDWAENILRLLHKTFFTGIESL